MFNKIFALIAFLSVTAFAAESNGYIYQVQFYPQSSAGVSKIIVYVNQINANNTTQLVSYTAYRSDYSSTNYEEYKQLQSQLLAAQSMGRQIGIGSDSNGKITYVTVRQE